MSRRKRRILGCALAFAALSTSAWSAAGPSSPACKSAKGKPVTCAVSKASAALVSRWLLKISGVTSVAGEDVSSMAWGASQIASSSSSSGGGAGKVSLQDLSVTQAARTPSWIPLSQRLFSGTHFPSVILEYYEPPDTLVLRYTLADAMVGSVQMGASTDPLSSSWSFSYSRITVRDIVTGVQTCWDQLAGTSC